MDSTGGRDYYSVVDLLTTHDVGGLDSEATHKCTEKSSEESRGSVVPLHGEGDLFSSHRALLLHGTHSWSCSHMTSQGPM